MQIAIPKIYHKYRNEIKTGDLILFESKDFISRIISWKTGSKATHAAMALWWMGPTGKTRLCTLESVVFGLYPTPLSNRLAWYLSHGDIYWHKMIKPVRHLGADAADRLLDYWGAVYDFKDLVFQAVKRVSMNPAALFCSEAICFAWKEILELPDDFIVPYPGELPGASLGVYEKIGVKIE